jgi:hypothetical protein
LKFVISLVFIIIVSGVLIACSSVSVEEYEGRQPEVNLETFFDGDLVAYGIVRNRSGKVTRYFQAALKGRWENGQGTLDEIFWFDDGKKQNRLWELTTKADGQYVGTAADVDGVAMIESKGNAVRLAYRLVVPYKNKEITVSMDDWMYQVAPGVIINEAAMAKWGFNVGKITLVIMKANITAAIPALVERFQD